MTDWLSDEFELVEISDASGQKVEMCYLATVEYSGKLYHILGTVHEDEADEQMENDRLLLVRQDCTPDGAQEYVVTEDENEIEQVFGQYMMETLLDEIGELSEEEATPFCEPPGRRILFAARVSICNNFLLPTDEKSCIIRKKGED
ncbi:MAG: DUF1292 domain-containing protein [Christensenellales bacterium]